MTISQMVYLKMNGSMKLSASSIDIKYLSVVRWRDTLHVATQILEEIVNQ